MVVELVVAAHPETAPVPAGTLGVLDQFVAQDAHRIVDLRLLDGRVLRVLTMRLHRVRTIAERPGAVAAAEGLQIAVVRSRAGIGSTESRVALHRLRSRDHLLGKRLGQRLEDDVVEADLGLPAGDHGEGVDAVDHCPLRGDHSDVLVEPIVHRQVGIRNALEGVGRRGVGLSIGGIHGSPALRVRPREVEQHPVGVDHHARHQTHRLIGEPVVVDVTFGLVLPLRQLRQFRPRAPIRVGDEFVHVEVHRLRTVAFEQRRQPPHPGVVGRELSPEVARRLALGPNLGNHQPEDVVHDLSRLHQLHRRDDHPFLVDFPESAHTRRGPTADVHVVGQIGEIAVNLALVVERRDHHDVVQVSAAGIGVVGHQVIPRAEVLNPVLQHRLAHRSDHRAEVVGLAEGLGDGAKIPIEEAAREITAGLNVGGVGATPQRRRHLLRGLEQAVPDDLELDRIDLHGIGLPVLLGHLCLLTHGAVQFAPRNRSVSVSSTVHVPGSTATL